MLFIAILVIVLLLILGFIRSNDPVYGPPSDKLGVFVVKDSDGYHLQRNGKEFYVKGAAGNERLSELAEAGGNTIRVYSPDSLKIRLDEAQQLGLTVVADIPLPNYSEYYDYFYEGEPYDSLIRHIKEIIIEHKDHPALLFWMLGNEMNYGPAPTAFRNAFNSLVDTVHYYDPHHPVSTSIIAHELQDIFTSLDDFRPDFVSINIFGSIERFRNNIAPFSLIWSGPYLISEWGNNGPWEETATNWGAPIEPPGPTQGRLLKTRYVDHISTLGQNRCLGNLVFYWGYKYEHTDSWFSIFDQEGNKSERYLEMAKLWDPSDTPQQHPRLEYLLINERGAEASIVLTAGDTTLATANFSDGLEDVSTFKWVVKEELSRSSDEVQPERVPITPIGAEVNWLIFLAPESPGPYRLFLKTVDTAGYFTTANIPFYVLKAPADG